jgi:hypothetical protein
VVLVTVPPEGLLPAAFPLSVMLAPLAIVVLPLVSVLFEME